MIPGSDIRPGFFLHHEERLILLADKVQLKELRLFTDGRREITMHSYHIRDDGRLNRDDRRMVADNHLHPPADTSSSPASVIPDCSLAPSPSFRRLHLLLRSSLIAPWRRRRPSGAITALPAPSPPAFVIPDCLRHHHCLPGAITTLPAPSPPFRRHSLALPVIY